MAAGVFIDMTGKEFGDLVVIKREPNQNGKVVWKCLCKCGKEIVKRGDLLREGKVKNCGCKKNNSNFIDETGKRYGKLTVLRKSSDSKSKHIKWICQCDCGKQVEVVGSNLRRGNTKSCGCLRGSVKVINEIGNIYGKLTVIERAGSYNNSIATWKCKCDCGRIVEVLGTNLRAGCSKSCGFCIGSKGEEAICKILKENNIPFKQQKIFNTCRFNKTGALAKFDFYIDNKYLLEYDGEQHFGIGGWGEDFNIIKERDNYKNQWCKDNNIPLIRIPYTHLKDLCIEDLMLETSKFILDSGGGDLSIL